MTDKNLTPELLILKRLREPPFGTETSERNLMTAAADEIERLRAPDQHSFLNMLRSLHNIDGYQLPELTWGQQIDFVQNPVKHFIQADDEQQAAIWREVMKRQVRS